MWAQAPAGQPAAGQAPAGETAAAKPAAGQPQWKDRAEYDLVDSIGKETDGNKKLALLNQWKEKYPSTEFKKLRAAMYLQTYQALNQPAKIYSAAKDVLDIDPKDMFALSMISYLTPVLTNTSPDALALGEKAAQGVLSGLETTFGADKKPANMTAEQWTQQRTLAEAQAEKTLGWIAMIRKNAAEAEDHFTKSLEKNPAQGDVSYWLGQTIIGQKDLAKYPLGLWHVARAAAYEGAGALPASGRTQVNDYLAKAYGGYHGDATGLDELKTQAKTTALPPAGFTIKSVKQIAEDKLKQEQQFAESNPKLALWKRIKEELMGPNGQQYFESSMKDAQIPELRGWLVEQRPKELVIAISDKTTPELTLRLDAAMPGTAEPGTELTFEGIGKEFTKEPFMVTMDVEKAKVSGWPAQAAPAKRAPAKKPARRR
jgi:tetratricopeptide (TPR) repeat protein